MADFNAAVKGALNRAAGTSEGALPSLLGSANPFANAPTGTKRIVLTIRAFPLTLRWDAGTATAGANGIDYPLGTYEFDVNPALLASCRAIQNGGTTTGWVQFFG